MLVKVQRFHLSYIQYFDIKVLLKNLDKINGIYVKDLDNLTAQKISNFYKQNPFPNYSIDDNKSSILSKGNNNIIAKEIKNKIGLNKNVIEVGAGTCQMSNYFAIGTNNRVVAFDATIKSLEVGYNFSKNNHIENIQFVNGDIFDDIFEKNYFDLVWCNGVLHHTQNPQGAFDQISKILKPGGLIVIGLYNYYGRFRTHFRRKIFKFLGNKLGRGYLKLFDPTLRNMKKSQEAIDAWVQDQYIHPVEFTHTFSEVFLWFKKNGIEPVYTLPSVNTSYLQDDFNDFQIIKRRDNFDKINDILIQINMIFSDLGSDGGLFIVVGKKC